MTEPWPEAELGPEPLREPEAPARIDPPPAPEERRSQRHVEAVYLYSQKPAPLGPEVRGPERQLEERQQERDVKKRALAYFECMRWRRLTTKEVEAMLGVAKRTLEAWRSEWRQSRMEIRMRGRPPERVDQNTRDAILETLWNIGPQLGLPSLKGLFPDVADRELEYYIARFRFHWDRGHLPKSLQWMRVGRVWAMDYADAPHPIEGVFEQVLTVRDMASGKELAAAAVLGESGPVTADILERLFIEHGAPLVVKRDNGKSLAAKEVEAVLSRYGATYLPSPAYTPSYNGSCEAGNGSVKELAAHIALRNGRAECWALDDLQEALNTMNNVFRRWGPKGPTYQQVWDRRQPISETERKSFLDLVNQGILDAEARRQIDSIAKEQQTPDSNRKSRKKKAVSEQEKLIDQRRAVRNALLACGLLVFRRRRIPLLDKVPA